MDIIIDKQLKLRSYQPKDKSALYKNSVNSLFLKYMEYKKFSIVQFNIWLKRKKKSKDTIFFVIEYKKKLLELIF